MSQPPRTSPPWIVPIAAALIALTLVFVPTLQIIPNGSEHYFMIDAGETQIVLNTMGTLHATGYPLYVMTGSVGVMLLRAFDVSPAAAPAVVSLVWGLLALGGMGVLAIGIRRRPLLAAALILVYGLTRTVWIHHVVAEIYTFTLLLLVGLLLVALRRRPVSGRIYWLALLGGIAVGHHRALIVVAPALIYAVLPDLIALLRRRPAHLLILLALGLVGLTPYAYLFLRAHADAAWVYGEPGTLAGLWDQFIGREAARFIGTPDTLDGLIANVRLVSETILTDISIVGVVIGIAGLLVGITRPATRRAAITLSISGGCAYLFHCLFYTDVLSALILIVTFSLACGWFLLADVLMSAAARPSVGHPLMQFGRRALMTSGVALVTAAAVIGLIAYNRDFVLSLTTDRTGIETIALAQHTPPGSTLMLPWGSRHFAVGFARSVQGILPGVDLIDHKADMRAAAAAGTLVTPDTTFYRHPKAWWEARIGAPIYLRAVAPHLIGIDTTPERAALHSNADTPPDGVSVRSHRIACTPFALILDVSWQAYHTPPRDLSVFVHLLDSTGALLAQDDHGAPVYDLRPLTGWLPGEIVRDVYALPHLAGGVTIRYGLYAQHADGSFENVLIVEAPLNCAS
ncbi:MAG: DUF2723 domain-containing protein [Chloroflexota bacterium]|nr:DUF2723 domain-containing protein [Chloroflexota bacterium]